MRVFVILAEAVTDAVTDWYGRLRFALRAGCWRRSAGAVDAGAAGWSSLVSSSEQTERVW